MKKENYLMIKRSGINGKIEKGYVVHHIDGDKQNNNINNLKLMLKREHDSYHSTIKWAKYRELKLRA